MRVKLLFCTLAMGAAALAAPQIFPRPRQIEAVPGGFLLDSSVAIALPSGASRSDRELAAFLSGELADRFQLALKTVPIASIAAGQRCIVMGSVANPWIRNAAAQSKLQVTGEEGYVLEIGNSRILVAGHDDAGAFYGLQSLRQLLVPSGRAHRRPACTRLARLPVSRHQNVPAGTREH